MSDGENERRRVKEETQERGRWLEGCSGSLPSPALSLCSPAAAALSPLDNVSAAVQPEGAHAGRSGREGEAAMKRVAAERKKPGGCT